MGGTERSFCGIDGVAGRSAKESSAVFWAHSVHSSETLVYSPSEGGPGQSWREAVPGPSAKRKAAFAKSPSGVAPTLESNVPTPLGHGPVPGERPSQCMRRTESGKETQEV